MANNFKKNNMIVEPRINHEIKGVNEVRLIYKEFKDSDSVNDFNKIVSWKEAVYLAKDKKLDLIEINPNSHPVIVKLADYSKYWYELKKKNKQQNKKPKPLKEIRLNVNIAKNDMLNKVNKTIEFLKDGNKVKVVLTIKGRNLTRREESKKSFYEFIQMVMDSGVGSFDTAPKDEAQKSFVIFKKK